MRRRIRSAFGMGLFVSLLVPACAGPADVDDALPARATRAAITHGDDAEGDLGVVAVGDFCSGTLIGPRAVLTAAHCVHGGATPRVGFGDGAGELEEIEVLAAVIDPAFEGTPPAHDLAVLVLATPAPAAAQITSIRTEPPSPQMLGDEVRIVGYGAEEVGASGASGASGAAIARRRRQGTARLDGIEAASIRLAPAPSQPCHGDSGGPVLWSDGASEVLIGVTSTGDAACDQGAHAARVDVAAATFVAPFLAALADGWSAEETAALGARCRHGFECESNLCMLGAGGDGACSERCVPGIADCSAGFECRAVGAGRYACLAPALVAGDASGCAIASAGSGVGVWLLGLLALVSASLMCRAKRAEQPDEGDLQRVRSCSPRRPAGGP